MSVTRSARGSWAGVSGARRSHDASHAKDVAKAELAKLQSLVSEERKAREKELTERRNAVTVSAERTQTASGSQPGAAASRAQQQPAGRSISRAQRSRGAALARGSV